jgi:quercetin dioxygenase-like cupin family protein
MHIKACGEIEAVEMGMPGAEGVTMRVVIGPAQGAKNFVMRVFEVAPGGHTPLHRHDFEHEIFIHAGRGEIIDEGATKAVEPGHVAFLAPNNEHQIRNTGPATLVFVCVIPHRE